MFCVIASSDLPERGNPRLTLLPPASAGAGSLRFSQ